MNEKGLLTHAAGLVLFVLCAGIGHPCIRPLTEPRMTPTTVCMSAPYDAAEHVGE